MKEIKLPLLAILLLTTLLLFSACASLENQPTLIGTDWKLVSFGPVSSPLMTAPETNPLLHFEQKGKISGNFGCNSFGGDYKINGNQITLGQIASTLMYCQDPVMVQESTALQVLTGTPSFTLENGKLTIMAVDGKNSLTFEQITAK